MNWEIHPLRFPLRVRDGFLDTSLVLVEHGYNPPLVLASLPCFFFVLSRHLMLLPFGGTDDRGSPALLRPEALLATENCESIGTERKQIAVRKTLF